MFVRIAKDLRLFVLGSFLIPSALAAQPNLVLNPNFTSGVTTNWTSVASCVNPLACTLAADNTNFFPTTVGNAPSARLTSSEVDSPGQFLISDCTILSGGIVPGSSVDLGAYRRTNGGNANSEALVSFVFYSGGVPCNQGLGAVFTGQATITNLGETSPGSTWFLFGQQGFVIPATTTHFQATLQVRQNVAAGVADFSFDHIFLGPPGTTPVDLQSFSVE